MLTSGCHLGGGESLICLLLSASCSCGLSGILTELMCRLVLTCPSKKQLLTMLKMLTNPPTTFNFTSHHLMSLHHDHNWFAKLTERGGQDAVQQIECSRNMDILKGLLLWAWFNSLDAADPCISTECTQWPTAYVLACQLASFCDSTI